MQEITEKPKPNSHNRNMIAAKAEYGFLVLNHTHKCEEPNTAGKCLHKSNKIQERDYSP